MSDVHINTVEPVYNGHPRDFEKWPLNTGGRLIQVGQKCSTGGRFGRAQNFINTSFKKRISQAD